MRLLNANYLKKLANYVEQMAESERSVMSLDEWIWETDVLDRIIATSCAI